MNSYWFKYVYLPKVFIRRNYRGLIDFFKYGRHLIYIKKILGIDPYKNKRQVLNREDARKSVEQEISVFYSTHEGYEYEFLFNRLYESKYAWAFVFLVQPSPSSVYWFDCYIVDKETACLKKVNIDLEEEAFIELMNYKG